MPRIPPTALAGLPTLAAGVALCALALPMAVSDFAAIPGDAVLEQLRAERPVTAPALRRLQRSRERAAAWRADGRARSDLALARLMLAEYGGAERRAKHLAHAETALAEGLAAAPMNPYGWLRLVQVRTIRCAPANDITPALRLALRSGPHEDRRDALLLLALEAGLRGWTDLDPRERALIAHKAREAWRRDATAAAAAAVRAGGTDRLARLLGFPT